MGRDVAYSGVGSLTVLSALLPWGSITVPSVMDDCTSGPSRTPNVAVLLRGQTCVTQPISLWPIQLQSQLTLSVCLLCMLEIAEMVWNLAQTWGLFFFFWKWEKGSLNVFLSYVLNPKHLSTSINLTIQKLLYLLTMNNKHGSTVHLKYSMLLASVDLSP